jgi:hypothetical protein
MKTIRKIKYLTFTFSVLFLCSYNLVAQTPTLQWVNSFGSGLTGVDGDFVKGMVKDNQGNFFITGMIQGTVDFDPSPATYNLISSGTDKDIYTAKYDSTGKLLWARLITGFNSEDIVRSITIDKNNNVYVAGIVNFFNPSCIIRKWDTNGINVWAKQIAGEINVKDIIAVDDGIIITGIFEGTKDFDLSAAVYTLSPKTNSPNDAAVFFAKYDFSFNFIFAKIIHTQSALSNNISLPYLPKFGINGGIPSIATDNAGNIYLSDKYADTASFALPATTATLNGGPVFQNKLFIAKYDPNGQFIWVKNITNRLQNSCDIMNTSIKISNNAIYLSGSFIADSLDFDPSVSTAFLTTPTPSIGTGIWNTFMASYDLSGNYKWAKGLLSPYNNFLGTMRVDSCSNIYISGDFTHELDFDPSPAQTIVNVGWLAYTNGFLAKYDSSGNYKWAMPIVGASYNGRPEYLEVHGRLSFEIDKNKIYFSGTYLDTIDVDPSATTALIGSLNSSRDFFVARYRMLDPVCYIQQIATSITGRNNLSKNLEIYPNPFETNLTIRTPSEIKTIEVTNPLGQLVLNYKEISNAEVVLNLDKLEKGIYIIKIISSQNIETSHKIIRQ